MSLNTINYKPNLTDNLMEISKTLEVLKSNRNSLDKEIENDEIYKEKLVEKLKSSQIELNKIYGRFYR